MAPTLRHYPLGDTITGSPHSVCVSLPTLADVIGYEEKDPRVLKALPSGYPRFFEHPYLRRLRDHRFPEFSGSIWEARLTDDENAACQALEFAGGEGRVIERDGIWAVGIRKDLGDDRTGRLRNFFQHTGVAISSRHAEDLLSGEGLLPAPFAEESLGDPAAELLVRKHLHHCYGTRSADDVFLFRGGMNAFYAGFRAVSRVQRARGREKWIQLGWLYVDTIRILDTMAGRENRIVLHDVSDLRRLEMIFAERADEIAGIVTEIPTNPLVQTADIRLLRELADRHGVALILDPTIVSPHNVNVLPHADVHINSLTKYAGCQADVMVGALALNAQSPFYAELKKLVPEFGLSPYERDVQRLALLIRDYDNLVRRVNKTLPVVVEFLKSHPLVERVHWALADSQADRYRQIAHRAAGSGCIVTFSLKRGAMERFYDHTPMAKGPSFGAVFSMMCPFLYLAHYDLVTSESGRRYLQERGLDPELIRLSVGAEEPEEIVSALAQGLEAAAG